MGLLGFHPLIRLLLAQRAASTYARDNVETQPLSSPLASAVAATLVGHSPSPPEGLEGSPAGQPLKRSLEIDLGSAVASEPTEEPVPEPAMLPPALDTLADVAEHLKSLVQEQ